MNSPSTGPNSGRRLFEGPLRNVILPVPVFPDLCHATARVSRIAEELESLSTLLSSVEQEVLGGKRTAKRAVEFVGGRVLAKFCVLSLVGEDDDAETYRRLSVLPGEDGEPLLQTEDSAAAPSIHLSIAHDAEFVFCAATPGPVGVDVEAVSRRFERVRERIIRDRNREVVDRYLEQSGDDEAVVLARVWAAAECAVKTSRLNLWRILDTAELTGLTEDRILLKIPSSPNDTIGTVIQKIQDGHVFSYLRRR